MKDDPRLKIPPPPGYEPEVMTKRQAIEQELHKIAASYRNLGDAGTKHADIVDGAIIEIIRLRLAKVTA